MILLTGEQMFTIMGTMAVEINESIKVGAIFTQGEVRPVWFSWKGRQISIKESAFSWKSREGSASVLHFSVTDGQGLYEITFNIENLGWRIASTESS